MRQLECFKEIEKKSYTIWCDTGSHFRCFELLHYLFIELAGHNIKVSLNYFCEKHGKNSRDQHFSLVSHFIKEESMIKQLTSSQDICDAINKGQLKKNLQNERLTSLQKEDSNTVFKQITTKSFVIPPHEDQIQIHQLIIKDLRKYYNFFTDDQLILKTNFMSDQSFSTTLKNIKVKNSVQRSEAAVKTDKIEPIIVNKSYLSKKILKWRITQREMKIQIDNSQIYSDNIYDQVQSTNNDVEPISTENSILYCTDKCKDCQNVCKFRLSEINEHNKNLNKEEIDNELKIHGHPKSRRTRIRGKMVNRNISQSKSELKKHYLTYHSRKN